MNDSNPRGPDEEEAIRAARSCLGGCVIVGLAPIVGGIVGLVVGEAKVSEEVFLGEFDVLGYGLLGAAVGLGLGIAVFLALWMRR